MKNNTSIPDWMFYQIKSKRERERRESELIKHAKNCKNPQCECKGKRFKHRCLFHDDFPEAKQLLCASSRCEIGTNRKEGFETHDRWCKSCHERYLNEQDFLWVRKPYGKRKGYGYYKGDLWPNYTYNPFHPVYEEPEETSDDILEEGEEWVIVGDQWYIKRK